MKKLLIAALVAVSSAVAAHAATPTSCQGKIVFDTVYQKQESGKFAYYFQIRNSTGKDIWVDASVGGFPAGVSLFSPNLPGIMLKANENKQVRFGTGTNDQINNGMVRKFYDTRGTGSAWVSATGCKQ